MLSRVKPFAQTDKGPALYPCDPQSGRKGATFEGWPLTSMHMHPAPSPSVKMFLEQTNGFSSIKGWEQNKYSLSLVAPLNLKCWYFKQH